MKKVGYGPKAGVSPFSRAATGKAPSGASSVARTPGPAKKQETKEYAAGMGFLWGLALVFSGCAWNKFSSFGSFDIAWQNTAFRVFLIGAAVFLVLIAVIGDVFMFKNGESRCPKCGQKLGGGLAGSYSFENIPTYNGG